MTSMEEAMFIACGISNLRSEQEKAEFIYHIGKVKPTIINLLAGGFSHIPYESACGITSGVTSRYTTVERIMHIFSTISSVSKIVLTHKGREFLLKCLYPEETGGLNLGINIGE